MALKIILFFLPKKKKKSLRKISTFKKIIEFVPKAVQGTTLFCIDIIIVLQGYHMLKAP
jgi:hypothetical protein